MGAADFNTAVTINGTKEEVFKILKTMALYATEKREQYRQLRNCPYLTSLNISGENEFGLHKALLTLTDDELLNFVQEKKGVICVEATGPYGIFGLLEDVKLFHEMAEAAPTATFSGGMGGFGTGGDQGAAFELKDAKLTCKYLYPSLSRYEDDGFDEDDWEDDYDEEMFEEPEWDSIVTYDPINKKYIK